MENCGHGIPGFWCPTCNPIGIDLRALENGMGQRNFSPKHRAVGKSFNNRKHIDAMYDDAWVKYRAKFLKINPDCYACGVKAEVVDHLIPHQGDERLFKKLDNHIPLCIKCHNTVTSLYDRKYRAGNSIEHKVGWLNKMRIPGEEKSWRRVKVLPSYD